MSVSDYNKVSDDDSLVIQIEDPDTFTVAKILSTGEITTALTQSLPAGTGTIGYVNEILNTSAAYGVLSATTSASIAKVGANNLAQRKMVVITPTNGTLYWGFSNTVSSSNGQPLKTNQPLVIPLGPDLSIWVVTASGSVSYRITEIA